jgi:hypothetical protein
MESTTLKSDISYYLPIHFFFKMRGYYICPYRLMVGTLFEAATGKYMLQLLGRTTSTQPIRKLKALNLLQTRVRLAPSKPYSSQANPPHPHHSTSEQRAKIKTR